MLEPKGLVSTSPGTLSTLRSFAAALLAASPWRLAEAALVMLALSATEGVGLLLLVPLLQLIGVDAHQGPLNRVVEIFSAVFLTVGVRPTLGIVLGVYVAAIGAQGLLERRQAGLNNIIQHEFVSTLRTRLYRAIVGAKWTEFARVRASDFKHVLTDEVGRVGAATYSLIDLSVVATTSLVYVGLAARVSPGMTGLVIACGALLALTVRRKIEKARLAGEHHWESSVRLHRAISDHLASLKMAKGYGMEDRHAEVFVRLSADLSDVGLETTRSYSRLRQQLSLGTAVVLAVIVYVSYTVLAVSTAQLLLLLFLFGRLVPRLTSLYQKTQSLATLLPAFSAVSEMERRCLAAAEPVVERRLEIDLNHRIAFDRITLDYRDDGQSPAVRDVSLTIDAGSTTAIVGPSGAGKSTLADLLMGIIEPSRGRLLVDGTPLTRDYLHAWRQRIGYVPQDTFLFHESVRDNLLWARPGADEEDLWRALRLAAADTFVAALPQGLDTVVGDRGVLVSGGERQRLSLARALLRRPKLLILDEATSSLDSENEVRIQQAIKNLHQQMTIVVITHRLSTVRDADLIHVLDQGQLVESGRWDTLMARRSGRFRELCQAQGIDDRSETHASLIH
jgi:ATP-binding cassette, subfamily C, bacterial